MVTYMWLSTAFGVWLLKGTYLSLAETFHIRLMATTKIGYVVAMSKKYGQKVLIMAKIKNGDNNVPLANLKVEMKCNHKNVIIGCHGNRVKEKAIIKHAIKKGDTIVPPLNFFFNCHTSWSVGYHNH